MSRRLAGSRGRRIEWVLIAAVLAAPAQAQTRDGGGRALRSLTKAAAAAFAPAIEEPEAKLYEEEVPLRLAPPASEKGGLPAEYILEISSWDRAAQGWASPEVRSVAAGEDGRVAGVLPVEWLGESSPDPRRFRLRARASRDPVVWSAWRVFNARFRSEAAPPRAASPAEASSPEAARRLHLPKAAPRGGGAAGLSPTVKDPERKVYEADVPIQILPPSGGLPSGYLLELSFYDGAAQNWSEAISRTIEADPDGSLSATLPSSWLDEQAPAAVRWRLRVKIDGLEAPWSEWKMFGRRLAAAPKEPPEGQLRSAPTRKPSP
ncbi:MAG TPA: hypothetical protein VGR67_11305 [Candidatus Polarisedimenticolia bacterium]|jgi:hypothetical protein|nr:hypothetical protein [Candidatus Polarisedimenticolia bacterium]